MITLEVLELPLGTDLFLASRQETPGRLPITLLILHTLVDAVDKVCIHPYYKALYKAMHLVAFNIYKYWAHYITPQSIITF
jgi:Na+-translocating ferredoxin:NAD+ oxidoreductase RnfE subunit